MADPLRPPLQEGMGGAESPARPAVRAVDHFAPQRLRRSVLLIIALLLLNKLGTPGNLLCYAFLFPMALRSPQGALKALSISGLLITASDFFVTRGAPVGPLKYVLLLVAGLTLLRHSRNIVGQPFLAWLLAFGLVAAMLSIWNGYFVEVSLLKLASFTFGAFCLLNVAQLRRPIATEMVAWAFALILAVVVLSYGALAIGAGYGSVESLYGYRFSGYRGVFSHPQTLGVMAGIFATYLTALLLFVPYPHRRLALGTLLALLGLLYLSEARTGMLGYVLAMGAVLVLVGLARQPPAERRLLRRYQRQFVAIAFFGLLGLALLEGVTGGVTERATEFLRKGDDLEAVTAETLYGTRQEQIERALEGFRSSPWTGIGFGTDRSIEWQRSATLLSASTEKGFLPTAVLEEVGVIGSVFFVGFVLSLLAWLLRSRRYLGLATFIALLVVNLGEMVFFAFGGMATLCWAVVGMALAAGNAHVQALGRAGGR